jgi:hypothetical protein
MFTFLSNKLVYIADGTKGSVILNCKDPNNIDIDQLSTY